jgi:hypothetical protein
MTDCARTYIEKDLHYAAVVTEPIFEGVELKAWLLATGFHSVDQMDHEGAALGATSRRMVSIAHKASVADESSALG